MRAARALACVSVLAISCDHCGGEPERADLSAVTRPATAERPAGAEPQTPTERAAAFLRAPVEEQEQAARRATLLADGRRFAAAGERARALRAFEDALDEAEGPDAVLHCAAGQQAVRLGHWPLARRHLEAGLTVAVQPRRRAACLYDLALVEEAEERPEAAVAALRESLRLRPHGAVQRKLRALQAATAGNAAAAAESAAAESAAAESAAAGQSDASDDDSPVPTLDALCPAPRCRRGPAPAPAARAGWPELAFITREAPDRPIYETWLAAREEDGWRSVALVAAGDRRDSYGALEATETITGVRFEGARFEGERLVVAVAGGFDEHPGEAPRYFACAREHPESDDALACFEEAVADLPPPESWAFELLFERADGRLRVAERSPTSATQSAAP